ncbi:MAG TPA: hypothetical protein VEF04_13605, partial [Blastocatellia bacterium]|nr:hypothetical protein [Blastocatellia bacterium]
MKVKSTFVLISMLITVLMFSGTAFAQRILNLTDADKSQIIEPMLMQMLSISEEDRTRIILVPSKHPQPI